jgi:hypothetical protein
MLGNRGLQPERPSFDEWRATVKERVATSSQLAAINRWRQQRRLLPLSSLPRKV